jgi:DNA topoisomerase VI subunit A
MLGSSLEHEVDALAKRGCRYLTKIYLSRKLNEEDWL